MTFHVELITKKDEYKELTIKFIHFEKATKNRKKSTMKGKGPITDKRTDASWDMKNQFWAVGSGLGWTVKKKVWAHYEQLLRPVF